MGKYPIIFLNFRCNVPILSYEQAVDLCKDAVHVAYKEHAYLLDSNLHSDSKELCRRWISNLQYNDFKETNVKEGIKNLSEYVSNHFGSKYFALIDEYDSICAHAAFNIEKSRVVNNIIQFANGVLNTLINNNKHVERGFLTGISQICS